MKAKQSFTGAVAGLILLGQVALAEDVVKVTADTYVRAETDYQVKTYVENTGCFGKFVHTAGRPTMSTTRLPFELIGTRSIPSAYLI
jgi:hypothetical protein